MQIPRSYVENYSKALNVVSDKARAALVDALSQIDYTADVATIREAVIAIMQPACGASSTMAARLAADFYDGLRARFGIDDGYKAEVDSLREPEATEGAIRAFAQDLVDGKPTEQFINKCASRIDYEIRKAANECVALNARRDPLKPRWARVPVGVETCQFCLMLASRGFAYHSESTASHAHSKCDCKVVPSWDKSPMVQGYSPYEYEQKWRDSIDAEARERAERKGTSVEEERKRIYGYYEASSKHAKAGKESEWFFAGREGMESFKNFREVELYLKESKSQSELEQRFSSLANIYGTQALRNKRLVNAAKHAEKRFK